MDDFDRLMRVVLVLLGLVATLSIVAITIERLVGVN